MKRTEVIKSELEFVRSELERINEMLIENKSLIDKPFQFKNGKAHDDWSFKDALTSYVSKKLTLEWVLQ